MSAAGRVRVAIIGAGPAGSALAIWLARRGAAVTLFDDDRRPDLLVGESLVPAAIPILQSLGVEQRAAEFSRRKPGVSFIWSATDRYRFTFARFAPDVFPYAYNVPRPRFDDALTAEAVASGVVRVSAHAGVERAAGTPDGRELALSDGTLTAAPSLGGRQPDLIVDATGRARLAARVLGIEAEHGPRKDVAHFAHFERFDWDDEEPEGQVLVARGRSGWSWCIPLRDRLSVGIVLTPAAASTLGRTPAERLERTIRTDPWLLTVAGRAERVGPVATFANYQLISRRGHGPGWVAVGDAFGFVDPMLSPGVFLSLRSAQVVADALAPVLEGGRPRALTPALFDSYAATHRATLAAWMSLVETFYDGRMLALMRAGRDWTRAGSGVFKRAAQDHIERHIALQASGARTTARYSRLLLRFLARHGLRGIPPSDMALR
jgi:flavin-dependent dehydrogenase